ncbi:MAG: type I-C CRISPR-associated protein Cas5 [Nitrospirae bacterium]|nr:type I-C CRISPR-associated protein Cas5 [Nitrospirota bacterium]
MQEGQRRSRVMRLKVWGDNACFTRPEMKVERVSYDVMTPSAARGVLEAIHWKPAIRWQVMQIDVLKPIKWESVRRNEVGIAMSPRSQGIYVDDPKIRQQRAGLFLRDVTYTIHACFELTDKAGIEDTMIKHQEMFLRRAEKGQCFHRPYLGCREFAASFELIPHDQTVPEPIADSRDLGWMLYDMDFGGGETKPRFFRGELKKGILSVPAWDSPEVRG